MERGDAKTQSVSVVAGRRENLTFMGCLYTESWEETPRVYESLCSESPHVPEGTRPKLSKKNTITGGETMEGRKKLQMFSTLKGTFPVFFNKEPHIFIFTEPHKSWRLSCLEGLLSSTGSFLK